MDTLRHRRRQLLQGIGALLLLVVLVAGVPAALWRAVGWPLPHALPSLDELRTALGGSDIADATIVKAIAVVCWLAWTQLATCVATELYAWVRARPSRPLPFSGYLQPTIGHLVATAAFVLGAGLLSAGSTTRSIGSQPALANHVSALIVAEPTEPAASSSTSMEERLTSVTVTPTYVVRPRDSLWHLAEVHLSDPFRWRELCDLNRGVSQPDGSALRDPDLIRPGWVLRFPADAVGLNGTLVPPPGPSPTRSAGVVARPSDAAIDSASKAPSTLATVVPTSIAGRDLPQPEDTHQRGDGTGHFPFDELALPAGILGSTLMAAGVLRILTKIRRARQRHREPGTRLIPLPPNLASAETAIRLAADMSSAEWLDITLRAMAAQVGARRGGLPPVLAVEVSADGVEILFKEPAGEAPAGFGASAGGRAWNSDQAQSVEDFVRWGVDAGAPLPGLVSLGKRESGTLLVDLESAGVISVIGDEEASARLLRSAALELATNPWADHLSLVYVGKGHEALETLERVTVADTLVDVIENIEATGAATADALARKRCASTLQARLAGTGDGWSPTLVICTEESPNQGALARLEAVSGPGKGVGAMVATDVDTTWRIALEGDELEIEPLGIRVQSLGLAIEEADAVEELLRRADAPEAVDGRANGEDRDEDDRGTPGGFADPPFEVEVRVLGPVEVVGGEKPVVRGKSVELLTYLALHPQGVSDGKLKTALWAEKAPSPGTFNTTASVARGCLGIDNSGSPHFPPVVGQLYRLGPSVTSDVARFEARVRHAARSDRAVAVETLRGALELIRGQPFEVGRGYEWAYTENLIANMEAAVADAAHVLAQLYLDVGDTVGVHWAATQGLRAAPGFEVLYRDRMLAFDIDGNPGGIETLMDELCRLAEELEPHDAVHPETLELYERFTRRRRHSR